MHRWSFAGPLISGRDMRESSTPCARAIGRASRVLFGCVVRRTCASQVPGGCGRASVTGTVPWRVSRVGAPQAAEGSGTSAWTWESVMDKPLLLEGCALSSVQALRTPAAPEYGLRPNSFLVPRAGPHAERPFPLAQSPCHQDFCCEGRDGSGAQWTDKRMQRGSCHGLADFPEDESTVTETLFGCVVRRTCASQGGSMVGSDRLNVPPIDNSSH